MFYKPSYCLGVGVNYRNEIANDLVRHLDHFDFIEIATERLFVDITNTPLSRIIKEKPIVLHGLTLSIGSEDYQIPYFYLENLANTLATVNCHWFSEHIAATHVNGIELRSLMPVEFSERMIDIVTNNARKVMGISNKPFLLENIAYYFDMPKKQMPEAQFISSVVNQADCGLLLDLNNLYVNAYNHKYDVFDFIQQLPLDRIVEIHLAGCDYMHDMLIDTHASPIRRDVFNLFEYLCRRTPVNAVVIERDARLNHFSDLLSEVKIVRDILRRNKILLKEYT